jgi:hypothetical protein
MTISAARSPMRRSIEPAYRLFVPSAAPEDKRTGQRSLWILQRARLMTCHYSVMPTAAEICIDLFKRVELPIGPGLSEDELGQIEIEFGFAFDSDHRELLGLATPLSPGWLDWRSTPPAQIRAMLAWPTEGVLWDAHNNDFWPRAWGRKPKRAEQLNDAVLEHLKGVTTLVPIYSHRFMAAGTSSGSAPVFSVYQTDVIYYGENLPDYVAHELNIQKRFTTDVHRDIPFWSALAERNRRYVTKPSKGGRAFWNRSIYGDAPLPTVGADGKSITYSIDDPEIDAARKFLERLDRDNKKHGL